GARSSSAAWRERCRRTSWTRSSSAMSEWKPRLECEQFPSLDKTREDPMPGSRRAFLTAQGALFGASLLPGRLLAAVETRTPPMPALDDWKRVREQFRLTRDYLHFAGFYISSHPAPVRAPIAPYRRAL